MIVEVDPESAVPVYEQLRAQIERLVLSGELTAGVRLPSIRQLAADLGIARGTVNRVYELLARDGLVASGGRHGTVVLDPGARRPSPAAVDESARTLALVARQLGLTPAQAHEALSRALALQPAPSSASL
ncbi:GntR family transcriptional regulator [Cellulomonas sp. HZM]|uniref:GntR family transcriptional regulator n=1 Tax=Cellulomonas sp. HZM TaxID=1454010 RepID=UPI0004933B34|nr:GntR family transcriptional regulator [Cellulomonas sp. HZM]